MTDEMKRKLKEASERLLARWKEEAVSAPLTPEGDEIRRIAAYKHQSLQEMRRELDMELLR